MDPKRFWDLIAWARAQADDPEGRQDALEEALATLEPEEILGFYLAADARIDAGWREDLALVAYLANSYGHRSDYDDLVCFLCWLIDQGRATYEGALADPDSLADVPEEPPWERDWESEALWNAAPIAWAIA